MLNELRGVVEGNPRLEIAEIARRDGESLLPGRGASARETAGAACR
jgi:hypothetical protein